MTQIEDVTATLEEATMILEEMVEIVENALAAGDFSAREESGIYDALLRAKDFLAVAVAEIDGEITNDFFSDIL